MTMDLGNLKQSALVSAAEEARWPTRWWLAYLVSIIVMIMIVGAVVQGIAQQIFVIEEGSIAAQIAEAATFAATFLAMALWVRFKEGRPANSLGFRGDGAVQRFGLGIVIGAAMLTLSVLVMIILGQYQQVAPSENATVGWPALLPFVLLLGVWVIQASTEETISRGYQIQVGALQLPGWVAVLLPGLIFAGLHFVSFGLSEPLALINIIIFALVASFIALRQGSLWLVCGIHVGWNWFQGNAFGVPVSGMPRDTALFKFAPTENALHWLSGGSFGPEGSLVVTVVWGVALVIAYRYFVSARKA